MPLTELEEAGGGVGGEPGRWGQSQAQVPFQHPRREVEWTRKQSRPEPKRKEDKEDTCRRMVPGPLTRSHWGGRGHLGSQHLGKEKVMDKPCREVE